MFSSAKVDILFVTLHLSTKRISKTMQIIADSGSTKTTWLINDNENEKSWKITTQGINPYHMSYDTMERILKEELIGNNDFPSPDSIHEIAFYGAGCTREKSPILKSILQKYFPLAIHVEVDSDMLGAAKALFGDKEGIACILGTGSNSCLYDGKKITSNISPMGYILGDEGSGAVLGKTFVNMLYKGIRDEQLIKEFESETGLKQPDIIQRVYREQMPNRFLASLAPFINKHTDTTWVNEMVIECFRAFFRNNTSHYNRNDLECSFVGSIAYHFEPQLREAAALEHIHIGKILKEPL